MNDLADHPVSADIAPGAANDGSVARNGRRPTLAAVSVAVALLAGGGAWWHHQVTRDPGLELHGRPNLSGDEAGHDRAGLEEDLGGITVAPAYEPFRPFTLARSETVNVRLEYRLADCDPAELQPNGTSTLSSLRLQYRILGVTRTAHVPFRDTAVALQAGGPCRNPIVRPSRAADHQLRRTDEVQPDCRADAPLPGQS